MNGVWCVIGRLPYDDGWLDSVWSTEDAAALRMYAADKAAAATYHPEYSVEWFPIDALPGEVKP